MTDDQIPDSWTLGQCVYEMSTGRRCQKEAKQALKWGHIAQTDPPAYGYCHDHAYAVTKPRDPRIHKTAEPLTRQEPPIAH